jgi:hypothetical protein
MSKIEVDAIDKQSGSTLTLGGSGTAVTLACGATQTGFGRTGTVDWQTGSIKTATFTAANGEGYFADTSSGAFTMNLPSATAGNIVSVVDYTNTFQTHNLTISPNGTQKIGGINANAALNTEGQSVTFVYVDDTEGWKNVQDSTSAVVGNDKIIATGGTVTTCGDYKIHTFTGPGSFAVSVAAASAPENVVDYLVVAAGGGGGGGGAGGGGMRFFANPSTNPQPGSNPAAPRNGPAGITVSATSFPITIGAGGTAGARTPGGVTHGGRGSNTIFSTITSTGGGGGGHYVCGGAPGPSFEGPGGSGGGSYNTPGGGSAAGTGNTPPVSPSQGSNGGDSSPQSIDSVGYGGGGGMMAVGATGTNGPNGGLGNAGAGGAGGGVTGFGSSNGQCSSSVQYFAGGGGGGAQNNPGPGPFSTAGLGGGGQGSSGGCNPTAPPVVPGDANTGGGAGGGSNNTNSTGGVGGSGIVVIRYKFQN